MKEPLRVEVEPLGDQRWEKIERALMERVESEVRGVAGQPTRRGLELGLRTWLVAASVVGALAIALVIALRPLPDRATLEHPSRITTGQSSSHLALPGLALEVAPESAVVVGAETPQGLLIVLDRGSIVCQVAPRQSDAPLIVQAGAARVRVVGTRFSVTRLGEDARVKVYEGVVEVTSNGESQRVRAGQEWPAKVEHPRSPLEVTTPRAPTEAAGGQLATDQANAPSPATGKPRTSAEATRPRSSQQIFEEATLLEHSDPARASRLYRSLESGSGSWAQNALYARGRLAASRGNPSEARRLLERYLERFPRGSNAEDARAVLRRLR